MFKIRKVEVDGFWGSLNLVTELSDGVNIFIGRNGTGKTTFINLLEASLTADLFLLDSIQFSEIRLFLKDHRRKRKITITKTPEIPYDKLHIKIGSNTFFIPLIYKEPEYRRRIHPKYIEEINSLKASLDELVNISWLSVHRELLEDEYRETLQRRNATVKNPIDQRIDDLTRRFTSYQLLLQSSINRVSDTFKKDVLTSILYSEEFDKLKGPPDLNIDLENMNKVLLRTYSDLGLLDNIITKRINEHTKAIKESIDRIRTEKESLTINDILPFSLLSRTQHIVDLSTTTEKQKTNLRKPVNDYLNILGSFIKDKAFELDPNLSGELIIKKGNKSLAFEQLSSGEKQLFILLTEALLQRNMPFIFIADEPELSLHVEWQRNILSQVNFLNSNAQIIVATHSPEIAGKWRNEIINMKDIIHD